MSQLFSSVGIQDGKIIEASEISQSVEAFLGTKAYDINISGSLTLSGSTIYPGAGPQGSIRLTGSLINDGPGQFSHMGLSTAALPDKFALYVAGEDPLFDPKVLIEGSNTKFPQIQLANEDTNWALRIKDVMGDFEIVQSASSAGEENLTPFTIQKNTNIANRYYLYLVSAGAGNIKSGNIGIGFSQNQNVPNIVNNLVLGNGAPGYGSLAVFDTVKGSLLKSSTISASATTGGPAGAAGENIHGTASYATYIEVAQTASYAAAENPTNADSIAFFYNIDSSTSPNNNSQINSIRLNALTGSVGILQLDSNNITTLENFGEGLYIGNPSDNYYVAISGSNEKLKGTTWIGNPYTQGGSKPPFIEINQFDEYIKLGDQLGGSSQIVFSRDPDAGFDSEDLFVYDDIIVSGSGANKVEMDGFDTGDFVLFASNSLEPNSLKFDVSNNGATTDSVVRIANMNTAASSELSLQIGVDPHGSNSILNISSSRDVKIPQGSLNYGVFRPSNPSFSNQPFNVRAYESLGRSVNGGNASELSSGYQRSIQCNPVTTGNSTQIDLLSIVGKLSSPNVFPPFPSTLGDGVLSQMYSIEMEALAAGPTTVFGSPFEGGMFLKRTALVRWNSSNQTWVVINAGVTDRMLPATGYNNTFSSIGVIGGGTNTLSVRLSPASGTTIRWASWVNIKTPGPKENQP